MLGQAERLVELKEFFRSRNEAPSDSTVLAFTSGKGGTGKTFLSLNISYELSMRNKKVLYADLDFNLANAHLLLDLNPSFTLTDFFLRRALLQDIIFKHSENFHLVFGESGRTGFPEIPSIQIENFIAEVKKLNYDFVILDLPAGAGKSVIDTLSFTDCIILTATTEPTAVMDAYALSKLIRHEKIKSKQLAIINKCRTRSDGEYAFSSLNSACEHFLKSSLQLIDCISYSNEAYDSVCAQKLASKHYKSSQVVMEIGAAAQKLIEIKQLANILHPAEKNL